MARSFGPIVRDGFAVATRDRIVIQAEKQNMGSVNWEYLRERGADRVLRSGSVSNLGPIPQEDRRGGVLYTCHGPMPLLQRNSTPD
jgi:hypothetical protein